MNKKIKKIVYVFLSAVITIVGYIFFHELGHLIVMLSAGATITEFGILTAHVSAVGGNYNDFSALWLHANGALLPVIVSLVYMLSYKKNSTNLFYKMLSYFFSLIPIFSLFAWVIIPFLYIQGNAPVGDDVTKFLLNFTQKYHPLIVSAVAMLIIAVGVTIMIKKDIIKNFILEVRKQ